MEVTAFGKEETKEAAEMLCPREKKNTVLTLTFTTVLQVNKKTKKSQRHFSDQHRVTAYTVSVCMCLYICNSSRPGGGFLPNNFGNSSLVSVNKTNQ